MKGAKDLLSKILSKNVEIVQMPYSQYNKTNYSSCMAVLNFALNQKFKQESINLNKFNEK